MKLNYNFRNHKENIFSNISNITHEITKQCAKILTEKIIQSSNYYGINKLAECKHYYFMNKVLPYKLQVNLSAYTLTELRSLNLYINS